MPVSTFDPELSAQLHNEILRRAWIGAGRDLASLPSTTWWEISSPVPAEIATKLNPNLICFLRLAKTTTWDPEFCFFYFLHSLQSSEYLHSLHTSDRFIYLYNPTSAYGDEEVGIIFDQETELAAYVAHHYDLIDVFHEPWAWKPLQDILQAYLEMIEEGKVQASPNTAEEQEAWPETPRFFPWQYNQYTARDVKKTNKAFTRLLDAIEHRLPQTTQGSELHLPYSPAILDEASIPNNSFIRPFFSEMPPRTLNFRYIAPGISIQLPTQFAAQPWKDISNNESEDETNDETEEKGGQSNQVPSQEASQDVDQGRAEQFDENLDLRTPRERYFGPFSSSSESDEEVYFLSDGDEEKRSDEDDHSDDGESSRRSGALRIFYHVPDTDSDKDEYPGRLQIQNHPVGHTVPFLLFRGDESSSLSYKRLFFPNIEDSHQGTSTGLYVLAPGIGANQFGDSCRLILPFNIGGRGHARFSNGQRLMKACDSYVPQETSFELYQAGRESGFLEFHPVQLHKILLNWAQRVEAGDWEVDANGVVGGIGKFEEADTPEHWKKYQIPLSW